MTTKEKIEEVLRNRILFIGEDIPSFAEHINKKCKSVYLGSPSEMIDELVDLLSKALK